MLRVLSALRGALVVLVVLFATSTAGAVPMVGWFLAGSVDTWSEQDLNQFYASFDAVSTTDESYSFTSQNGLFTLKVALTAGTQLTREAFYGKQFVSPLGDDYWKYAGKYADQLPRGPGENFCYYANDLNKQYRVKIGDPDSLGNYIWESFDSAGNRLSSIQGKINTVAAKSADFYQLSCYKPARLNSWIGQAGRNDDYAAKRELIKAWLVYHYRIPNPTTPISWYVTNAPSNASAECTPEICYGYNGTAPYPIGVQPPNWQPPTSGTTPTAPTAPACTRPDGSTSGNPYDCAPRNEETSCGIIDIPCNLKRLFIPDKDFLTNKLKDGFGLNVKFPLTVVDEWSTNVDFAGQSFKVGANFGLLTWSEQAKDQFRFLAWWGTFLFLLAFLGVPFMSRKAMGDAAQDHTAGRAAREAANNERIDREYEKWRNTPY